MAKRKRDQDSMVLNRLQLGESVSREEVSEAASRLAQKFVRIHGTSEMSRLGRLGARSFWDRMSPVERKLEMQRRSMVRLRNRKSRIEEKIAQALGRKGRRVAQ